MPENGQQPSFEQQVAELERVVADLERGDLPLEESVRLFERGVKLSEECRRHLEDAESRIQVLLNPKAKGEPRFEDLAVAADDLEGDEESGVLGVFEVV